MDVQVWPDRSTWVKAAVQVIIDQVRPKPNSVIGLATGNTTVPLYAELVAASRTGRVDLSQVITFNLDEYVGLTRNHPASCLARLHEQLFQHVPIQLNNIHWPHSESNSLETACAEYEKELRELGRIDLQILGIGLNGHIGFNEPGTLFESNTHITPLTTTTRLAKAHYFESVAAIPTLGITMGIGTILKAGRLVLLAFGADKAEIVQRALYGPITPEVPASALRLHPDFIVILDQEAATRI